jgi:hypothetical protein
MAHRSGLPDCSSLICLNHRFTIRYSTPFKSNQPHFAAIMHMRLHRANFYVARRLSHPASLYTAYGCFLFSFAKDCSITLMARCIAGWGLLSSRP